MDDARDRFRRNYLPAFLRYLAQRSEPALGAAYDLGRAAVLDRLSLLDVAAVHHLVVLHELQTVRAPSETERIADAASEFLAEVLAPFEMTQRGYEEMRQEQDRALLVERAVGMLCERHACSADAARTLLRRRAAEVGSREYDVAAAVLAGSA